jgi:hypothetical protein
MKSKIACIMAGVLLAGCATSGTQVLAPYQLADGSKYQDVVTIGADKTGTAPVVTHVKTFKFGKKSGAVLVADASGGAPGLGTVVTGAIVAGAVGGVTGGLIANATRRGGGGSENTCSLPANASLPECICLANPRTVGCSNAYVPSP